jgi:hypothetical protein
MFNLSQVSEIVRDPGHKKTYEVSILQSDAWKKVMMPSFCKIVSVLPHGWIR